MIALNCLFVYSLHSLLHFHLFNVFTENRDTAVLNTTTFNCISICFKLSYYLTKPVKMAQLWSS